MSTASSARRSSSERVDSAADASAEGGGALRDRGPWPRPAGSRGGSGHRGHTRRRCCRCRRCRGRGGSWSERLRHRGGARAAGRRLVGTRLARTGDADALSWPDATRSDRAPALHGPGPRGDRPARNAATPSRAAGYRAVELAGLPPTAPGELARLLDAAGLRVVAAHEGIERLREDSVPSSSGWPRSGAHARHRAVDPRGRPGERRRRPSLRGRARRVRRAVRGAAASGSATTTMPSSSRHSTARPSGTSCSPSFRRRSRSSWTSTGRRSAGRDPVAEIRATADRVRLLHMKDRAPGPEPHDAPAGRGRCRSRRSSRRLAPPVSSGTSSSRTSRASRWPTSQARFGTWSPWPSDFVGRGGETVPRGGPT